jgi:hypothetical protein
MANLNPDAVALLDGLGQAHVARMMGVSRQAVSKWRRHGIPPERAHEMRVKFPTAGWTKHRWAIGRGRSGR